MKLSSIFTIYYYTAQQRINVLLSIIKTKNHYAIKLCTNFVFYIQLAGCCYTVITANLMSIIEFQSIFFLLSSPINHRTRDENKIKLTTRGSVYTIISTLYIHYGSCLHVRRLLFEIYCIFLPNSLVMKHVYVHAIVDDVN